MTSSKVSEAGPRPRFECGVDVLIDHGQRLHPLVIANLVEAKGIMVDRRLESSRSSGGAEDSIIMIAIQHNPDVDLHTAQDSASTAH